VPSPGPLSPNPLEVEVRARLGTRYYTDLTPDTYRTVLIPPWANLPEWVMPAAVLGFIGLSAVFLLLMLLLGMGPREEWRIVWWQVGMGLVAWLIIVAGILGVYRKLWMK